MVLSASALADSSDILASNNQVAVQFVATHVDYKEIGNGFLGTSTELLDTEHGPVPGVALSITVMEAPENLYFRAEYDHSSGHTHYVGSYIGGTYGSVVGITGVTMSNYGARIGMGFGVHSHFMLTPYLEMGGHEWSRQVNYGETYVHSHLGAGLLAQFSPGAKLVLSADAMRGRTIGSYIHVNSGPLMKGFSGPLGNSAIYRIGIAADYAFSPNIHGNISMDYMHFKYGMSAAYSVGGGFVAWEPDSKTWYTTTKLGLGIAF
ncbi:MAG TPA: hypothetical protein VIU46_11170 [Gallionellaceae bacterium]